MKALIVDDSKLARQELKHLLKDFDEVEVIGEAENAVVALEKLEKLDPDVVFLDIQMPGKNGFELLQELESSPEIIFVTAYDQYALEAFEHNALDYLKKPIRKDRLNLAIEKAASNLLTRKRRESEDKLGLTDQVFVKDGEKCWFIELARIRLFQIEGNNTKVFFENEQPLIPKSLSYMEQRLSEKYFFRANRQEIINLKWVEKIEPWFSGTIKAYLKGGEEVEVSRRQSIRFKELMSF